MPPRRSCGRSCDGDAGLRVRAAGMGVRVGFEEQGGDVGELEGIPFPGKTKGLSAGWCVRPGA